VKGQKEQLRKLTRWTSSPTECESFDILMHQVTQGELVTRIDHLRHTAPAPSGNLTR
jgi:hypothetical protein